MSEQLPAEPRTTVRRQLRLAIVCYGGVSLCIYMHGATKEIHRLVRASRLLAGGFDGDTGTATERTYRALLTYAAARRGAETDVVVDVIAGTSAGGINGIYLAKALAHDLSQDDLRDLWLDKGDIEKLVRGPRALPLAVRAPWVLAGAWRTPPLRGRFMGVSLYDAFAAMDGKGPSQKGPGTLMPEGHSLQLFVTMTDFYGYDRQVASFDPRLIHDRRHRHVLEFRYGDGEDMLTFEDNLALAFAARATSSVQGAFAPVSVPLFHSYLPTAPGELSRDHFRIYELSDDAKVDDTYFIDGGVLDNRPFGHAIEAILKKPAGVEVDRRLLYLEPDPEKRTPSPPGKPPSPISTALGAFSTLPGREPILDDLLEVARLNERVRRTQDVIKVSFEEIAGKVAEIIGDALDTPTVPELAELAAWAERLNDASRLDAGTAYASYVRSKVGSVVDGLAAAACTVCAYPTDSNHAFLVRSVFRRWAQESSLFGHQGPPSHAQLAFLRDFDLDYGVRRLQFVVAGVNWWYSKAGQSGYPSRAQLDAVKTRLWSAIGELRRALSGRAFTEELSGEFERCFPAAALRSLLREGALDPEADTARGGSDLDPLLDALRKFLTKRLENFTPTLYRDMESLVSGWPSDRRKDLLVRYLGFPFWDVLLYPIQAAAGAGERDTVEVVRMSPLDANLLQVPGGGAKLEGVGFHHFRAFFKRRYRENDYLWGRLDAAERLVGMLIGRKDPEYEAWCGRAFRAILDEEEPALHLIESMIRDLRKQADALH